MGRAEAKLPTGKRWENWTTPRNVLHVVVKTQETCSRGTTHPSKCATAVRNCVAGSLDPTSVWTVAAEQLAVCRQARHHHQACQRLHCLGGLVQLQIRHDHAVGCASSRVRNASQYTTLLSRTAPPIQTVCTIMVRCFVLPLYFDIGASYMTKACPRSQDLWSYTSSKHSRWIRRCRGTGWHAGTTDRSMRRI